VIEAVIEFIADADFPLGVVLDSNAANRRLLHVLLNPARPLKCLGKPEHARFVKVSGKNLHSHR
jgi:hypothetical protein